MVVARPFAFTYTSQSQTYFPVFAFIYTDLIKRYSFVRFFFTQSSIRYGIKFRPVQTANAFKKVYMITFEPLMQCTSLNTFLEWKQA